MGDEIIYYFVPMSFYAVEHHDLALSPAMGTLLRRMR